MDLANVPCLRCGKRAAESYTVSLKGRVSPAFFCSLDCLTRYAQGDRRPSRGGHRAGAGRKPLPVGEQLVPVTVRLPREYVDWIRTEGGGNVSEGLRRLLEDLDQRQGAARSGPGGTS